MSALTCWLRRWGPHLIRETCAARSVPTPPTTCAAFRIEALSLLLRILNVRLFTSPRTGNSHNNPPRRIGIDLKP